MKIISNFQFPISNTKQTGFTLIEVLVVIALLLVVGTVIGSIIFSSFQGVSKTNATISSKQNGDYAMSVMAKMIRNAKAVYQMGGSSTYDCTNLNYSSITIENLDNYYTTFTCDTGGKITSTSATLTTDSTSVLTTLGTPAELTDSALVKVTSCSFTCTATNPPTIGIIFSLGTTGGVQENNTSLNYSSAILDGTKVLSPGSGQFGRM